MIESLIDLFPHTLLAVRHRQYGALIDAPNGYAKQLVTCQLIRYHESELSLGFVLWDPLVTRSREIAKKLGSKATIGLLP